MPTAVTNDIHISVETAYQLPTTHHAPGQHMFAYRITIRNKGSYTIKLLRRHWFITDVNHDKTEVEGEGVVGLQPVLEPGESHQYVSGCALQSDFGKMAGIYLMERQLDGTLFEVDIPEFQLVAPFRLN
jgi:ApaG protein